MILRLAQKLISAHGCSVTKALKRFGGERARSPPEGATSKQLAAFYELLTIEDNPKHPKVQDQLFELN